MERNPKWDRFAELTAHCYKAAEESGEMNECWHEAFDVLMEIIDNERENDEGYARELGDLEKLTDFKYNIEGLISDYFVRLWVAGDYEKLKECGERVISKFDWHVESSSAIRIKVLNALLRMGKRDEAADFCREWIEAEPEDVNAVVAKKTLVNPKMENESC